MNHRTHYTDLGLVNTKEMFRQALEGKYAGAGVPIALHLDHGDSFELAKSCINSGFSSVMLDGSHHPFDENPSEFDPRKYLDPARAELIKMVKLKNEKVLDSAAKG